MNANLNNNQDINKLFFQNASKVETYTVIITPEIAAKLITQTDDSIQRKTNKQHVRNIARQMNQGKWRLNGDAIRQDVDGNAIDGYHRLKGCIMSGASFCTLFVKGLPSDMMNTIDIGGRSRTLSDILSINSNYNHKYVNTITASVRFIIRFNNGDYGNAANSTGRYPIDGDDFMQWISDHEDIGEFVGETMRLISNGDKLLSPKIFCGLKWILSGYNKKQSDIFFQKLSDGVGVGRDSTIRTLRAKLMRIKIKEEKLTPAETIRVILRCWNAYVKGDYISRIKVPNEMPVISKG